MDTINKLQQENEKLQKKLDIAVKALELYSNLLFDHTVSSYEGIAKTALKQIKELDNANNNI